MQKRVGSNFIIFRIMLPANFAKNLVDATLQTLLAIAKIFLLPFELWVKAISNLSEQKAKGALNVQEIKGMWPYFTFCKRLLLDFLFDAIAFLSYPLGVLFSIASFIVTLCNAPRYTQFSDTFLAAFAMFILCLLGVYVIPVFTALAHDCLQWTLLPLRKYIDWCKKPAQHLDLTHENKEQKVEE